VVIVEAGLVAAVGEALATVGVGVAALVPALELVVTPAHADSSIVKAIKVNVAFLIIISSSLKMRFAYYFTTNYNRITSFLFL
jgi:hypothetical protein